MKYKCIFVENRHYDQNTDKNDQLSNLRPPLAHAVEPQRIFFGSLIQVMRMYLYPLLMNYVMVI